MATFEKLNDRRALFNRYVSDEVLTRLGLDKSALDTLGFAEVARRIEDAPVRRRFCELAGEMLDANIEHHRDDATLQPSARLLETRPWPVSTTLLAAAAGSYFGGLTPALVAAALWYWFAAAAAARNADTQARQAEAHNEHVRGWQETLREWELARAELLVLSESLTTHSG